VIFEPFERLAGSLHQKRTTERPREWMAARDGLPHPGCGPIADDPEEEPMTIATRRSPMQAARRAPVSLLAVLLVAAVAPGAASANQPLRILLPATDPFVLSGPCDFDVLVESTKEKATLKEWTDEDGSVRLTVTGQIQQRLTNLESGASVELSLSGPGHYRFAPDGSLIEMRGTGRWGIAIFGVEPGLYVASGNFALSYETLAEFLSGARGQVTDLCAELSS
jgi:hypothetical protein